MNLRKEIETLALWYIPVFITMLILSAIFSGYIQNIFENQSNLPTHYFMWLSWVDDLIHLCDNLVVATWLWLRTKHENSNNFLWAVFGLISHLFAVIIYLCLRIYEQKSPDL